MFPLRLGQLAGALRTRAGYSGAGLVYKISLGAFVD